MEFVERRGPLREMDLLVNGQVVSSVTYKLSEGSDNFAVIDLLYTPIEQRGKGYARKLLTHLLTLLPDPVFLLVSKGTFVTNFYFRCGFRPLSEFGCYYLLVCSNKPHAELVQLWKLSRDM